MERACGSLCGLQVSAASPKTKVVYCKDANRRDDFPNQRGGELGFMASALKSNSVCLIAAYARRRANLGSRMKRKVQLRFLDRAEVKSLRATPQRLPSRTHFKPVGFTPTSSYG